MEIVKAAILGIIQGLTEFFPVSSSAHLVIFPYFFKWDQPSLFFAVTLHFGTLISLLIVFYKDIINIIKYFFKGLFIRKFRRNENFQMALFIIIAIIPAGIAGYLFNSAIENAFSKPIYAALFLLVTAVILVLFEFFGMRNEIKYMNKENNPKIINYLIAIITGIGQAAAIIPGISRSGTTISTARIFGIKREEAVRFSFLISIPVIFGSFVFELYDYGKEYSLSNIRINNVLPIIIGFLAAFLSGLFAVKFLMRLSSRRNLNFFGVYCVILSLVFFVIYFLRK